MGRCWRGVDAVSCVKWKKERGESSSCGDQVFVSRVTTSTLAGEYVTARDYVGGRASGGNCGTGTSCTRRGLREKLWREMYVLSKNGSADYGARGHYDPPKHWISLCLQVLLRVHVVVSGQGRRSTRARGG